MSRIGLKPISVPDKVTVNVDHSLVTVSGPKGELKQNIHRNLSLVQEDGLITISRPNNQRHNRSQHGLARTLISNMVVGVTEGHVKALEIHGVGYRAAAQGQTLTLHVGYSHPVEIVAPAGISFEVPAPEKGQALTIFVRGIDKAMVGQVAADIRKVRKPDPYKGKGVRYKGEVVRLRPGKRAGK
ncbi:50S ribosomal protein L6 [Kamptonema cortianum]|nr:50S ribosomal protein L6 [Geitlerinema splendidum]MDK3162237.1 50S ribosomal protein L6 [Kamptonema cortianum]